jgi:hypothetical protein
MIELPKARLGMRLQSDGVHPPFSVWPVTAGQQPKLQHRIFSADPWPVIADAIQQRCPKRLKDVAFAFQEQAEDFYQSALDGKILHAKPLLLYYGMLNLAKARILTEDLASPDYKPHHGLSESAKLREIQGAKIKLIERGNMPSLFSDFARAIGGNQLTLKKQYKLGEIFPQILTGHRLWCSAQQTRERFVGIESLDILFQSGGSIDGPIRDVWVRIRINENDLAPLGVAATELIERSGLGNRWQLVTDDDDDYGMVCLEQKARAYQSNPTEVVENLMIELRPKLWSSVLIVPPYTKYYLYVSPTLRRKEVMPQLLSMYLTMFFLGSITRYRPHHFGPLIRGNFGAFIEGVVNDIPRQFLYLIASTFLRREIAKAAIV